jgi:hypothetical protein
MARVDLPPSLALIVVRTSPCDGRSESARTGVEGGSDRSGEGGERGVGTWTAPNVQAPSRF